MGRKAGHGPILAELVAAACGAEIEAVGQLFSAAGGAKKSRPWAATGRRLQGFSFVNFIEHSLVVFVQFLSNFHTVFPIQFYPTKFCLGNRKVTGILLKSIKFMNFYSCFPLQINKSALLKGEIELK